MQTFPHICDKLRLCGLSVIPIDANKRPTVEWKAAQSEIIAYDFNSAIGIGLVCGKVSGNVEAIDFDLKYDLTGDLMKRFRAEVEKHDPKLLNRLVWQKTVSGGYHAVYRCEKIAGNLKLAQRKPTADELAIHPTEKAKVLIETRGEGGYIAITPTEGYKMVINSFEDIPTITESERDLLHSVATEFNEIIKEVFVPRVESFSQTGLTPFDAYDQGDHFMTVLESHGWKQIHTKGKKVHYRRPGDTKAATSGNFDLEKRWFSVFTTSSEFEHQKAYKPSGVFTVLECKGDYHEAAKRLYAMGYGDRSTPKVEATIVPKSKIKTEEVEPYFANEKDYNAYLQSLRDGTFKNGLSTGIPLLDLHFLFKRGYFNVINGHDNVGKSTTIWYLCMLSAILHDWKWVILSAENSVGLVMRKLIEFYWSEPIAGRNKMNDAKFKIATKFVQDHFKIINPDTLYNYQEILDICGSAKEKWNMDGVLVDPYNSLVVDTKLEHQYHYRAASELKLWASVNDCCVYLNCHAVSSAMRIKDKDGFAVAPSKADTEGGTKFASKAADFLTIHRLVNSPNDKRRVEIHVRKVKEVETGGGVTNIDDPFYMTMLDNMAGYETLTGYNPIAEYHRSRQNGMQTEIRPEPTAIKPNTTFTSSQDIKEQNEGLSELDAHYDERDGR